MIHSKLDLSHFKLSERSLLILITTLLFLLSFRSFSAYLTPSLNSDHAIHILMAYHLKLPQDLYYWGQDRLGSLEPILAHLLLKSIPLSPIVAIACVQYAVLLIGFICFSRLFQRVTSRLIFAFVWFLPAVCFMDLVTVAQPYRAQLASLGCALVCFHSLIMRGQQWQSVRRYALLFVATLSLFVSLWVSDFTAIAGVLLITIGLRQSWIFYQTSTQSRQKKLMAIAADGLPVLLATVIGVLFIAYAKANADGQKLYGALNTPQQIVSALGILTSSLIRTLTFQTDNNLFLALQAICLAIAILSLLYAWKRGKHQPQPRFIWVYFCSANTVLGLCALVALNWVYANEMSFRYFVPVYVFFWLSILHAIETLTPVAAQRVYVFAFSAALASSLSLPSYVFAWTKIEPRVEQLQAFQSLGKAGIIGEYWSSYITCIANPKQLNCTSYDRKGASPCPTSPRKRKRIGWVRCPRCAKQVIRADTIYLVKDGWLSAFPDQIQQFGACLAKAGAEQHVAGYTIAPYRKAG